jgi:PAB1-binding protein PBP1
MTKINTKKSRTKRKRNKLLRVGIKDDYKTNLKRNIPILHDPSAVVFIGSQSLHQIKKKHQASNRQEPSFILQDDMMLIPMKNINEENLGLLMSTINRQGKRWNMTLLNGQNFFKIMM